MGFLHEIWDFIQKLGIKFELDYRLGLTAPLPVFKLFTRLFTRLLSGFSKRQTGFTLKANSQNF